MDRPALAPTKPALGFPLNAGVKTLLRSAAGVIVTALLAWLFDPTTLTMVVSVLPVKWAGIAAAIITALAAAHNAYNHRNR